jgi:hypothetical protein
MVNLRDGQPPGDAGVLAGGVKWCPDSAAGTAWQANQLAKLGCGFPDTSWSGSSKANTDNIPILLAL